MRAYEDVWRRPAPNTHHGILFLRTKSGTAYLVVASVILETLKDLKMEYPQPEYDVASILRDFDALANNI